MTSVETMINQLSNSSVFFYFLAFLGLIIILVLGMIIKKMGESIFSSDQAQRIWKNLWNWIIVFVVILYLFVYLSQSSWMYVSIVELGDVEITPVLILTVVFSLFLAIRISKAIRHGLMTSLYDRYDVTLSSQATINTVIHYGIILIGILFALASLGFSLTNFTVFAGVLGVGVGFGLQNIMNNFISGIIILFDRPIKVGDRVVIDDIITDIEQVRIRNTIVHTRKNERMVIPNSYFLEDKFINRSYSDRRLRIVIDLGVPYGTDVHLVTRLLKEAVYEVAKGEWGKVMSRPHPEVYFEEFDAWDMKFSLWFWIDDQSNQYEFIVPSEIRYLIFDKFAEQGIEFSIPRKDVSIMNKG